MDGQRTYDYPLSVKGKWDYNNLIENAIGIKGYARLFYELYSGDEGNYDVVIRSINSKDARTATVTNLPLDLLKDLTSKILELGNVKNVYFDITPKPPATIEYV